jgi:flagellar hook-associated protein 2
VSTNIGTSTLSSGSGIDVDTIVSNMVEAERAPERVWQTQQLKLQAQQAALNQLNANLITLDSRMDNFKDFAGVFASYSTTTSDASIVTATASAGAAAGQHTIQVDHLATKASYYSNTVANGSTVIPNGTLSIKVGTADAVAITIDSTNNTLDKLAADINQKGLDVTASVITDAKGARLVINGNQTGLAHDVVITATDSLTLTHSSSGANASLSVDGVPIESGTNTVTGVIPGVTLDLQAAAQNKAVTVSIKEDTGRVSQAINNFVSSYNSIVSAINDQFAYDATTQTAGALSGDASVRGLQQQLLEQISYSSTTTGDVSTLAALGITMNDDGTLALDSTTLNSALQSNFANVKNFFQGDGSTGFAIQFSNVLGGLTDSTTGSLTVDLQGNSDSQKSITDQINNFEVQVEFKRQQWLDQFSRVDAILRQFPLTQAQVTAQLDSLANLK